LFTETNGSVAFFANGVLKGSMQTGNQSPYGVSIDLALAGSSQAATNNLGVIAGSDAGGAAAGGNLLLGAGSATGGDRNGGHVYIYSGAKNGSGTDGNINLIPSGSGKIKLGSSSTVGYVWTATGADGSGAWQAASGGASLGNLEVANTTLRPVATGENIRITTKDSGGFTGTVFINSGFQSAGGTSGAVNVYSGDSNGGTGSLSIYTGAAGSTFNSGSITITTGSVSGGGVRGKIKLQDGTQGTVGHVWTQTASDGTGSWQAPSGGGFAWNSINKTVADNGATLSASDEIRGDTSGGAFTLLLPPSPTSGQRVRFLDKKGSWFTNNLTVDRNGQKIRGAAANFALAVNYGNAEFVFTDSTDGWLVYIT
jgi:hypothetical protein